MHVAGRVSEARQVSSSHVGVRWSVASWQALHLTVPLGASRQSTLLGLLCVFVCRLGDVCRSTCGCLYYISLNSMVDP